MTYCREVFLHHKGCVKIEVCFGALISLSIVVDGASGTATSPACSSDTFSSLAMTWADEIDSYR